jgi:acetyl esterase/lipase
MATAGEPMPKCVLIPDTKEQTLKTNVPPYRYNLHRVGAAVAAVTILLAPTSASPAATKPAAATQPAGAPPMPKGFASTAEVLAAIQAKQIKMIDLLIPPPPSVEVTRNVTYGKVGERELQLDLYQPKGLAVPVPGIVIIHGGGWGAGARQMLHYYGVKLAERGYVAANISYRLTGEAPYPAAVQDAKCAVRWMRANAAKYKVDPNKLAVLGGSAGGHLAMMVGYSSDVPKLEGDGGHKGVSSRVQAVIDFYGPTDLTTPFARGMGVVQSFLGGKTYDEAPDLYKEASPLAHLTKDDPPTLILHGTIDDIVPIDQADSLAAKLKDLHIPFAYERFDGWPHVMDVAKDVNARCMWAIDQFLAKYLPLPKGAVRNVSTGAASASQNRAKATKEE